MPATRSIMAYSDIYEMLDKAVESERGISISAPDKASCIKLRQRVASAISAHRTHMEKIYPQGHALHGVTPYDKLSVIGDFASLTVKVVPRGTGEYIVNML